jgi:hypothetical protein
MSKRNLPFGAANRVPKDDHETRFCEAWLRHHDHRKAWVDAGYSPITVHQARKKLITLTPYLERIQRSVSSAVAKKFVLDQQSILDEMIAVGFANPQDYIEEYVELVDDQPVTKQVRKNIMKLSRAQAAAVTQIDFHPDGTVSYKLPDADAKHPFLKDLGQHLGLFHPKLIQEHRHKHMHAHIDMKDVNQEALMEAEAQLLKALGHRGNLLLGLQPAQDDDVIEGSLDTAGDTGNMRAIRR